MDLSGWTGSIKASKTQRASIQAGAFILTSGDGRTLTHTHTHLFQIIPPSAKKETIWRERKGRRDERGREDQDASSETTHIVINILGRRAGNRPADFNLQHAAVAR